MMDRRIAGKDKNMAFWDELSSQLDYIGKKINDIGEDAVRATKDFSRQQKLKGDIADEKRKVNAQYLKLGRMYYEAHKDEEDKVQDPAFQSIGESLAKIADAARELEELKDLGAADSARAQEEAEAEEAAKETGVLDGSYTTVSGSEEDPAAPLPPADDSDFE